MTPPTRALVYRCGAIGDTVVALPAINALRRHLAGATFTLMTANHMNATVWTDEVLREFGWFDGFITYRQEDIHTPNGLRKLIQQVRHARVDLAVHLGSDWNSPMRLWRDRLFFAAAGVPCVTCGHSPKVGFSGRLRRKDRIYPSEVTRLLEGLRRHGLGNGAVSFDLPIREAHRKEVATLLDASPLDLSRPLIGMCPGSKQEIKRWPVERFAELGSRVINDGGANLAIVGGPEEAAVGNRIGHAWPHDRWINLADRLTILESAELLRRCLFYVGNDTGAMHVAAAVGTRCVAIFGAREPPGSWHPYGDNHIVLRKNVPCRNCYRAVCGDQDLRCLKAISVEEVWSACRRMMVFQ